jgi:phosphatidylserine decarboxylase
MPRLKANASPRQMPPADRRSRGIGAVTHRAARQKYSRRERRIGLALIGLFAVFFAGGVSWTASVQWQNYANAEALAVAEVDKERRRAAVLFVPLKGNVCRRRVIDNQTWLIADAGFVTCDEAVTWNSNYPDVKFQFAERIEQLRTGFRQNPAAK